MPIDFGNISDENLATLVPRRVLELDEAEVLAANFVFWFLFYVERKMNQVIFEGLKRQIGTIEDARAIAIGEVFDSISDELTFGSTISILEKALRTENPYRGERLISHLRMLNGLRNRIAHGRIRDLNYKDHPVRERATRELMWNELMDVFGAVDPR